MRSRIRSLAPVLTATTAVLALLSPGGFVDHALADVTPSDVAYMTPLGPNGTPLSPTPTSGGVTPTDTPAARATLSSAATATPTPASRPSGPSINTPTVTLARGQLVLAATPTSPPPPLGALATPTLTPTPLGATATPTLTPTPLGANVTYLSAPPVPVVPPVIAPPPPTTIPTLSNAGPSNGLPLLPAPEPTTAGSGQTRAGGWVALDVPAGQLDGRPPEIRPYSPASVATLRATLPAGFDIGESAFEITVPGAVEALVDDLVQPLTLTYLLTDGELHRAAGDVNRVRIAHQTADGWIAQPCTTDSDSAMLTCSLSHMSSFAVVIAPPAADELDWTLPSGHFFKQANGFDGAGSAGFAVTDDEDGTFWSEFERLGGLDGVGYPISARFVYHGFETQAFQKLALQWHPELGQALPINVLDELSFRGSDDWLEGARLVPAAPDADETALPWDEVASRHLALLGPYPLLMDAYENDPDAVERYGLPVAVDNYGAVVVVRAQRATLQLWLDDRPWAAAGTVVVGNAGDLAKESGLWPMAALVPVNGDDAEPTDSEPEED
jgi:hypothetical protein